MVPFLSPAPIDGRAEQGSAGSWKASLFFHWDEEGCFLLEGAERLDHSSPALPGGGQHPSIPTALLSHSHGPQQGRMRPWLPSSPVKTFGVLHVHGFSSLFVSSFLMQFM